MYIGKNFKIICEIMHATEKIDGASQSTEEISNHWNYITSYSPGYGEFENLLFCFCSGSSCAFIYNAVDVNKIATAILLKLPP